jgi:hypothetical protein
VKSFKLILIHKYIRHLCISLRYLFFNALYYLAEGVGRNTTGWADADAAGTPRPFLGCLDAMPTESAAGSRLDGVQ